eukprot:COSAG01_NODE_88_length_27337_cov_22.941699_27_plen_183_part_00
MTPPTPTPPGGELFLRVHWVAVPEALRARRVNRWRQLCEAGARAAAMAALPRAEASQLRSLIAAKRRVLASLGTPALRENWATAAAAAAGDGGDGHGLGDGHGVDGHGLGDGHGVDGHGLGDGSGAEGAGPLGVRGAAGVRRLIASDEAELTLAIFLGEQNVPLFLEGCFGGGGGGGGGGGE